MAVMTRLSAEPRHLSLALAFLAVTAHAQQGEGGAGGAVQARLGVSQSWTDNLRLSEQNKDAALITTVSPGISVNRRTGTVRANVDYALNGITYIKTSSRTRVQNDLRANIVADLLPGTFSVTADANVGRQNLSAFGALAAPTLGSQSGVSALDNPNSVETGTLRVSPLLRGQLGGFATVELRGDFSMTEARGQALGDSHGSGGSLRVSQAAPGALSWYAQLATQQQRPKGALSSRSSSAVVGLEYKPDPDWSFGANVGQDRSNYRSANGQNDSGLTGGVRADWTPTSRTRLGLNYQRYSYGNANGISFEHRMRTSVWRYADSRTVTVGNAGAAGGVRTNYDLYFLLLASQEPDPIKRDALVRSTLLSLGLSPEAPASLGFLSSGASQLRSQSLSWALQGVRSSLTALVTRGVTSRLDGAVNQGDLATNAQIEQRSYSLTASYQLSPTSGLSMTGTRQESLGDAATRRTQLTSWLANWTWRLGSRLNVQLGARHSTSEGVTSYTENAVFASLNQQF
jgi:uncharacterized protein (PEP-CTERM system associated)